MHFCPTAGFTIRNVPTHPSQPFWYSNGIHIWGYAYVSGNEHANYNIISDCILYNNSCNGIRITASDVGQSVKHNTISNCEIYNNGFCNHYSRYGIYIAADQDGGGPSYAKYNTIENCTIHDNYFGGIRLGHEGETSENIIKNCEIYNNSKDGIYLESDGSPSPYTHSNQISGCWIFNNSGYGVNITLAGGGPCDNNLIYNNYLNNTNNAYDGGSNTWNISKTPGTNIIGGPYLGGNYWSDYNGIDTDGDGLGNTNLPYNSSGNIQNGGDWHPLVVTSNVPPTADFSYSPLNPTDLDTIQFTDSSSDSDGSIVNWTWNFGDGTISYQQNPSHQYADDGTYNVTLTVTDNDGATGSTYRIITVSNVPPTADFSYHFNNKRTVVFTDKSSDSDGTIANWSWIFGDGGISYEKNPTHRYLDDGTYNVTLTVTDDDGATDSVSKRVLIDTIPPSTEIWVNGIMGKDSWYISDYVIIAFMGHDSGSGIDYTMYRLDDKEWEEYNSALGIWQNGEHTIEYYSVDNAGNIESIKSYSFKIDNKPPEVEVLYPNGGETINGTVTIEWNAIDNCDNNLRVDIEYSSDNGITWHMIASDESNNGAYEWDTSSLPDGTDYLIKISTSDDAGNIDSNTSDGTFTIYNPVIPPSVSIIKPRGHLYIDDREIMPLPGNTTIIWGAITIEATAESVRGIEKVEFYIDDELKATLTEEPYQWAWDEPAFFTHTIKVIAYDNVGNTATDEQAVWIFNP